MKTFALIAILFFSTVVAHAEATAQQLFDSLTRLSGTWTGTDTFGNRARITFRTASAGTVLISELVKPNDQQPAQQEDMISMIHVDGTRLLLTHYCSAGNQPRMKATASPDGKTITFEFVDGTNIASPATPHMQRVVLKLLAPNHHIEEWTFSVDGKESTNVFDLRLAQVTR